MLTFAPPAYLWNILLSHSSSKVLKWAQRQARRWKQQLNAQLVSKYQSAARSLRQIWTHPDASKASPSTEKVVWASWSQQERWMPLKGDSSPKIGIWGSWNESPSGGTHQPGEATVCVGDKYKQFDIELYVSAMLSPSYLRRPRNQPWFIAAFLESRS